MKYISEDDAYEQYDEFIDEISGDVVILGMTYCASRVLKECDPIGYSCEFDNWLDSNDLTTSEDEAEGDE